MPSAFALLTLMIFIAVALSWVVPAGKFDRAPNAEGRMMVVPGTYHLVESNPASIWDGVASIPTGIVGSAAIIFTVLLIGGCFTVIEGTGILQASLSKVTKVFKGKELLMIPIVMIALSVMCSFIGLLELSMVMIPIMIPICLALRMDSMTALAIPLIATAAGFGAALANPFTVVIAQGIGELPLYSGAVYRTICLSVITLIGIVYVMRYAAKVRKDPTISVTYERDKLMAEEYSGGETIEMNGRRKLALVAFLAGFGTIIFGALKYRWGLMQIDTVFIAMAIACGFLAGMSVEELCEKFSKGLSTFVAAALISGFARAITVVLEDTSIIDSIINGVAFAVQALPPAVASVGMLVFQCLFNFIVPSGSGQALITMPIMIPLADILGVTRQTAILAFQFGDGFSNILWPTLGYLWACIGFAKVRYEEWVRFVLPLLGAWYLTAAVLVFIAQMIQWQ